MFRCMAFDLELQIENLQVLGVCSSTTWKHNVKREGAAHPAFLHPCIDQNQDNA
jgi:hypothetical protein